MRVLELGGTSAFFFFLGGLESILGSTWPEITCGFKATLCQAKSAEEAFEIYFEAQSCSHLGCFN